MKSRITCLIGAGVALLSFTQFLFSLEYHRLIGIVIGVSLFLFGWKIGWTAYRRLTLFAGHAVLTVGCLVTAYSLYQIPFLETAPSFFEVLDMPLFWGLFTIAGGYCMITHGFCNCAIRLHDNKRK